MSDVTTEKNESAPAQSTAQSSAVVSPAAPRESVAQASQAQPSSHYPTVSTGDLSALSRSLTLGLIMVVLSIVIVGAGVMFTLTKTFEVNTGLAVLQERLNSAPAVMAKRNQELSDIANNLRVLQQTLRGTTQNLMALSDEMQQNNKKTAKYRSSIQHIETDVVSLADQFDKLEGKLAKIHNDVKRVR